MSLLGTLRGHKRGVWGVEFSPVDKCVATASGKGEEVSHIYVIVHEFGVCGG